MWWQIVAIPLIAALIGYITNVVAVKMLFLPRKPVHLGFYTVQGLLPKRQAELARSLGELVEKQLLSMDDLFDRIAETGMENKIMDVLVEAVRDRLTLLLPRMIPGKLTQMIADTLEKILRQEMPGLMEQLYDSGREYLTREIQISKIVEDKVNQYDLHDLEEMIKGISASELTFIEALGGVLGFVIGLGQLAISLLF